MTGTKGDEASKDIPMEGPHSGQELDMESVLEELGGFGKYQIFVFLLGCLGSFVSGMAVVNIGFVGMNLDHRCLVPECDVDNSTSYEEDFLNFTTPYDKYNNRWDRCRYYATPYLNSSSITEVVIGSTTSATSECRADQFDDRDNQSCSDIIFDTSLFQSTTVTEFNLICGRAWLQPYSSSMYMVGMLFGAIIMGDIADRLGRRLGLMIACVIAVFGGFLSAFSVNYSMFLVTRFLCGVGNISIFLVSFVAVLEFVPPSSRRFCGMIIEIPFALGEATVALFAYFMREWRYLQAATTGPCVVFLILVVAMMPENFRWLVSQGRIKEAERNLHRIAEVNKKKVTPEMLVVIDKENPKRSTTVSTNELTTYETFQLEKEESEDSQQKIRTVFDLLKTSKMRKRTLNMAFSWVVVTMSYYGLSANAANLGGDVFVNFVAIMLIEVPSYIFAYLTIDWMGRKGSLFLNLMLGGIGCIVAAACVQNIDLQWLVVVASMTGKFGAAAAFAIVYIYTAELYSTEYRSLGVGVCCMAARIGGISAPFIANLGSYYKPLPLLVFGILSLTSGFLIIMLPETAGLDLPQTMKDSEELGSDQSILDFACLPGWKKRKSKTQDTKL